MQKLKTTDGRFAQFASHHWQWVFLCLLLTVFSGLAFWSVLSMMQSAEERFRLEALTNCKVLEVAIADTISQHTDYKEIQARIEALVEKDHRIVRLSFIALAADNTYRHVASSLASRIDKPAHEEDLEAIASGKVVILDEDYQDLGALDITYPVHAPNGNILGLIGYTVSREKPSKEPIVLISAALMAILSLVFYCIYQLRRSFGEIKEHKKTERILRDSDRMKNEFISTAAHELRTPLTSVMGYAELLLHPESIGGVDDDLRQEFLQEIFTKSEALCAIIDDLLDMSRIESGRPIPIEKKACDLGAIIRKEVGHFRIHAPRIHFELSLPPNQGGEICADRYKIVQVLENLISNAVKFSPDGGTIRISGTVTTGGYRLTVADEGIGMTPQQVERIFDKFYRVDYKNTAIGGLGLGMNIVRHIIAAHEGDIQVVSELGKGTVVTVDLPAGEADSIDPQTEALRACV